MTRNRPAKPVGGRASSNDRINKVKEFCKQNHDGDNDCLRCLGVDGQFNECLQCPRTSDGQLDPLCKKYAVGYNENTKERYENNSDEIKDLCKLYCSIMHDENTDDKTKCTECCDSNPTPECYINEGMTNVLKENMGNNNNQGCDCTNANSVSASSSSLIMCSFWLLVVVGLFVFLFIIFRK